MNIKANSGFLNGIPESKMLMKITAPTGVTGDYKLDYGTLIFKWSDIQIPTNKVIEAIGCKPLFGNRCGRKSKTHWMTFMKLPEAEHDAR